MDAMICKVCGLEKPAVRFQAYPSGRRRPTCYACVGAECRARQRALRGPKPEPAPETERACGLCKRVLPIQCFPLKYDRANPSLRRWRCGYCRHGATARLIREAKSKPCADCGQRYPYYVMEFDHLPQYEKSFGLSKCGGKTKTALLAEIAKCEVVCANCHKARTWVRATEKAAITQLILAPRPQGVDYGAEGRDRYWKDPKSANHAKNEAVGSPTRPLQLALDT